MIVEDPRSWLRPVFEFHKADTFRKLLPLLTLLGLFTALVAWIELDYLHLTEKSPLRNITLMHGLLGFAISMLLVFRTNTAYERWWEGRKLWGALVNCSRNLAVKLHSFLPEGDGDNRFFFSQMLGAFARELCQHLLREQTRLALDERAHPELATLDRAKHVPSQLVCLLLARLNSLQKKGVLSEHQLLLLNNDVTALLDICGACERIKNTPIPYTYTAFIKKFIVAYTVTLPLGYPFALSWLAVPVVVFIFYVLASLELIAEQIEDPFGRDRNDIPMDKLSEMIAASVKDILED
jgi:ion channel-forming bestrophin family protein